MKHIWRITRNILGVIGVILLFGAIGEMDYHIIELGTTEPASAWTTLQIGVLMLLPSLIHLFRSDC